MESIPDWPHTRQEFTPLGYRCALKDVECDLLLYREEILDVGL